MRENIDKFQRDNPTKAEKEAALRNMTNEQIDILINEAGSMQTKIFYSSFKK